MFESVIALPEHFAGSGAMFATKQLLITTVVDETKGAQSNAGNV